MTSLVPVSVVAMVVAVLATSNPAHSLEPAPSEASDDSLSRVPDDILGQILNHIWDPQDLVSVSRVNRRLHYLTRLPLWIMKISRNGQYDLYEFTEWIRQRPFMLRFPDLPLTFPEAIINCFKEFLNGEYGIDI